MERVIPFFDSQPLMSSKRFEYDSFRAIVKAMVRGEHLTAEGFGALKARALTMNGGGKYRTVHRQVAPESSEAICQTPAALPVKIWSDLHGDMQSQAEMEMTWPPVAPSAPAGGNNSVGPYPPQPQGT